MTSSPDREALLTEVIRHSGVLVSVQQAEGSTSSTARAIPYAERYSQFSGLHETPIEQIQRAARDEAARSDHS